MDRSNTMKTRISKSLLAGLVSMAAAGMAIAQDSSELPTNGNLPKDAKASSWDPTYNVCRGVDPGCYHDWVGESRQNKVLIFTRTAGPRHANIGSRLPGGRNPPLGTSHVVQNALIAWLAAEGIAADWTEDVTQLSSLNQYKAVIFASNSRDALFAHGRAIGPLVGHQHDGRSDAAGQHVDQRLPRLGQGQPAPVHAGRRRLRRDPQRVRHRIQLALVRRPARQRELLRPRRQPGGHGPDRDVERFVDERPADALGPSPTSGTTSCRSRPT
jgi:hypothetical protein